MKKKTLKSANAARWNSQLKMIRSIPKLTAYEQSVITDLVEILTLFEEATDFAQIEDYPSAGYVVPCIRGLEHQISVMNTKYHCALVTALKQSLSK